MGNRFLGVELQAFVSWDLNSDPLTKLYALQTVKPSLQTLKYFLNKFMLQLVSGGTGL